MQKKYSLEFLRAFCALQVFILHYCTPRFGTETTAWFCGAVPTFLLMSAYLYGVRSPQPKFGTAFLRKRWVSLSVTYYPFILCVFLAFLLLGNESVGVLLKGLVTDALYLGGLPMATNLPESGHLWFMTTLMMCYIVLFAVGNNARLRHWFRSVRGVTITFVVVVLVGFVYRGGRRCTSLLTLCCSLMPTGCIFWYVRRAGWRCLSLSPCSAMLG